MLTQAIDALLEFVEQHAEFIAYGPAFDRMLELDSAVYVEAYRAGLLDALPQHDGEMVGRTNLPVIETVSGVVPLSHRWAVELASLRKLAEVGGQASGKRTGRPRKGDTDKAQLVIAALALHHQYAPGGSIGNWEPATVRGLAGNGLTTAAISRFLQKKFNGQGHKGYAAACRKRAIGRLLAQWQGDHSEGHTDLRPEEYGRDRWDQ